MGRSETRDVSGLRFVVRDDTDCVGEGTVLRFGGEVEGGQEVGGQN